MDAQGLVPLVPACEYTAAFHRHAGAALDVQMEFEGVRGIGDGGAGVAGLLDQVSRDVAGDVGVHQVGGPEGVVDADDRGQ